MAAPRPLPDHRDALETDAVRSWRCSASVITWLPWRLSSSRSRLESFWAWPFPGRSTDVGEDAELQNLRNDNEQLQKDLDAARAEGEAASAQGEGASELFARAYPTLMDKRLEGKNVAVVFLGPADGSARADVEGALADADAGAPARMLALEVPIDESELTATLEGDEILARTRRAEATSPTSAELGRELVQGDDTQLDLARPS